MICRLVRYQLSNLDGAKARAFASSHLEGCSACQTYQEELANLERALRTSRVHAPAPSFQQEQATIADPRTALPALGALVCALAVLVLVIKFPSQDAAKTAPPERVLASSNAFVPSQPTPSSPENLVHKAVPSKSWQIPQLRRLASQAPMQEELEALRQDSQRGLEAIMSIGRRE